MKIAAAQISCTVGEIQQNLETHYFAIEAAIKENVDLISFPEMSITGYCRTEAKSLAFIENDPRLQKLQDLSSQGNIIIVVGVPLKMNEQLYIASFIIHPNRSIQTYTKQHLHGEENLYFTSSMLHNPTVPLGKEQISLAICADINIEAHPCQAKKLNSTIYMPSIFDDEEGIIKAHKQLTRYAKEHGLTILMSNYTGELWGWKSGGKSGLWSSNGDRISHLKQNESALLVAENIEGKWSSTKVILS